MVPIAAMLAAIVTPSTGSAQTPLSTGTTQQSLAPSSTPKTTPANPADAPLSTGAAQQTLTPASPPPAVGPVNGQQAPPLQVGSEPQSGGGSYFGRNNNVSVLQRIHPGYDPIGIDLGGFLVSATADLIPSYTDNVFATDTDKVSDGLLDVTTNVRARSQWSRNELDFLVNSASNFYWQNSAQNTTNYSFGSNGRWDLFNQSSVSASLSYGQSSIPRTSNYSFTSAATPVEYDTISASVGALQTINRIRFTEQWNYQSAKYLNNVSFSGAPIALNSQNNNISTFLVRSDYAVTQEFAFFAAIQGNQRSYSNTTITSNRNSSGYQANLGADFDITRLVRGSVQIGYLDQTYVAEPPFHTVSGLSAHANVEYFPTNLVTLTLKFDRQVNDEADPIAISALQNDVSIQADYELLRQLIISASASYQTFDFTGEQRADRRSSAYIGGTYLLNEHVGLIVGYTFIEQQSTGAFRVQSFSANMVSAGISFKL